MADTQTDDIRAEENGGRQLQTRRQAPAEQPQRQARSKQQRSSAREVSPRPVSARTVEPVSRNGAALAQRVRPRSLWGQISSLLLQPAVFFRSLPELGETRQWLWIMVLVLALTGIVAVREEALSAAADAGGGAVSFPPDMGMIPEGDLGGGGGVIEGDFGGVPGDFGPPPDASGGGAATGEASVTANLTTALLAASNILIGWGVLMVLLVEVSLFNGRAPRLGQNFHIAIWTAVPLALMAGLKLLFYASGGEVGQQGIAGIVTEMPFYQGLSGFAQSLTLSLATRLTLFWLWSLFLIYFGARYALNGKRAAALLVVVMWVVVLVVVPVATGAIDATEDVTTESITPEGMEGMPPEGDFSGLMGESGMPEDMEIVPGETGELTDGELQELPEGFSIEEGGGGEGGEVIDGAATGELSGAEGEALEGELSDEGSGGGGEVITSEGGGGSRSTEVEAIPARPNAAPAQSEAESAPAPARSGMKG